MHVAVEYLYRSGHQKDFLSLPTTVYLMDKNESKVVLSISQCYGPKDKLNLKFYEIDNCHPGAKLPPITEFIVSAPELFTCSSLGTDRYSILSYSPPRFPLTNHTMVGEEPLATRQETKYQNFQKVFWSSEYHRIVRKQFLFDSFCRIHVKPETIAHYGMFDGIHYYINQTTLSSRDKEAVSIWNTWKKIFQINSKEIPGELVFGNVYPKMTKDQQRKYISSVYCPIDHL